MIAPRVSNSQPPLFVPWHCESGLGGVSDGPAPRKQSCARRRPAAIGVIQMSPKRSFRLGAAQIVKALVSEMGRSSLREHRARVLVGRVGSQLAAPSDRWSGSRPPGLTGGRDGGRLAPVVMPGVLVERDGKVAAVGRLVEAALAASGRLDGGGGGGCGAEDQTAGGGIVRGGNRGVMGTRVALEHRSHLAWCVSILAGVSAPERG